MNISYDTIVSSSDIQIYKALLDQALDAVRSFARGTLSRFIYSPS